MFNRKKTDLVAKNLDAEINSLLSKMSEIGTMHSEYPTMVSHLVSLMEIRNAQAPKPMSSDVKATILANLAGIVLIIGHEKAHVITTKALGFITKLR